MNKKNTPGNPPKQQLETFGARFENARDDFQRLAAPIIVPLLGGTQYISNETDSRTPLDTMMDKYAGIDGAVFDERTRRLLTVSNRLQWVAPGHVPANTFTLRINPEAPERSEFNQRRRAIGKAGRKAGVYPEFIVQAYCTMPRGQGHLLSLAVIRTEHLIAAVEMLMTGEILSRDWGVHRSDSSSFVWISWDLLARMQYPIGIYNVCNPAAASASVAHVG